MLRLRATLRQGLDRVRVMRLGDTAFLEMVGDRVAVRVVLEGLCQLPEHGVEMNAEAFSKRVRRGGVAGLTLGQNTFRVVPHRILARPWAAARAWPVKSGAWPNMESFWAAARRETGALARFGPGEYDWAAGKVELGQAFSVSPGDTTKPTLVVGDGFEVGRCAGDSIVSRWGMTW